MTINSGRAIQFDAMDLDQVIGQIEGAEERRPNSGCDEVTVHWLDAIAREQRLPHLWSGALYNSILRDSVTGGRRAQSMRRRQIDAEPLFA
jgi:hypothetical protein